MTRVIIHTSPELLRSHGVACEEHPTAEGYYVVDIADLEGVLRPLLPEFCMIGFDSYACVIELASEEAFEPPEGFGAVEVVAE